MRYLPEWKESARTFEWGADLGGSDETVLTRHFETPILVHRYPAAVKAFYMKRDPEDDRLALGMDVLAPEGYGEIVGGGERATDLAFLRAQVEAHGLPESAFDWYFDLRKYGSVPHAGFGLGLERTVAYVCGLPHVRETAPFPRLDRPAASVDAGTRYRRTRCGQGERGAPRCTEASDMLESERSASHPATVPYPEPEPRSRCSAFSPSCSPCTAASASAQPTGTIAVVGNGRVSVAPDRALVRLGVVTRAATAPEALRQHETDVARVLTRVRGFRVPDRDIQIEALSLNENYGDRGRDGYVAQRTVTVTLDSLRAGARPRRGGRDRGRQPVAGHPVRRARHEPRRGAGARPRRRRRARQGRARRERLGRDARARARRPGSRRRVGPAVQRRLRCGAVTAVAPSQASPGAYSAGSSEVRASVTVLFEIAR